MDFDFNNPNMLKKVITQMCFDDGYFFCKHRIYKHRDDYGCDYGRDAYSCRNCELFDLDMEQVFEEYKFLKEYESNVS